MGRENFRRKLSAILSAGVAGYNRLMGQDEISTVTTLLTYREKIFRLIEQHRGSIVDSPGGNVLAAFESVIDAVQCAIAVEHWIELQSSDLPEERKMQFRIGIEFGEVIEEQDRIFGNVVNVAARLEALADPGGICISETAFDHIRNKISIRYEFLGEKALKNIDNPVGIYKVLMDV